MVFDAVFERIVKRSPLTIMTGATMEHALDEAALESLFDRTANRQYTRKLLFSAIVELMALVVCNRISVHRAFKVPRANRVLNEKTVSLAPRCVGRGG